ncbi:MAG: hypothetical protein KZQ70_09570 [gamma proteobacterium symbiont of Lucinoma myriamae]|nr:hypothetical protein [gamma proteobacterium symbiont of Lucinoma myriamae]MCU7819269.1 hypothetical protein [gamma proteobacterium symbiont of Lucinoma myriamae]MCU7832750.1 hypothetical protein [gamma proteobacterium symbiont of Lucinoma myriamae]
MSPVKKFLFPEYSRTFYGKRWFDIALRTIHLMGLLGLSGGILFNAEQALWLPYFISTILSGSAMVLLSLWSNANWILQNRGLVIIAKVVLLSLLPVLSGSSVFPF